jgi:RHS repeat-associated protein
MSGSCVAQFEHYLQDDFSLTGNTIGMTSMAGQNVNQYAYLPFGETTTISAGLANPFTFVGQFGVTGDGSGLIDMRFRDYNPLTGQFVSNDPLGLASGDTNARRYVNNSTMNFVDPTGLSYCEITTVRRREYYIEPETLPDGFYLNDAMRDHYRRLFSQSPTWDHFRQMLNFELYEWADKHGWIRHPQIVNIGRRGDPPNADAGSDGLGGPDGGSGPGSSGGADSGAGSGGCPCQCPPSEPPNTPSDNGPNGETQIS